MTDRRPRLREVIADHLRLGSDPRTLAAAILPAGTYAHPTTGEPLTLGTERIIEGRWSIRAAVVAAWADA